jgi:hypothetical protein
MESPDRSLDPLTPSSIRRGDMLWGAILPGGGGWASSPTEGGGYCTAPPICAFAVLKPISRADAATSSAPQADPMTAPMLITYPPTL